MVLRNRRTDRKPAGKPRSLGSLHVFLEPLEQRLLLKASLSGLGTADISTLPDDAAALQQALLDFEGSDLKGKDGPLAKLGFDLTLLHAENLINTIRHPGTALENINSVLAMFNGQISIDVTASGDPNALRGSLAAAGMTITASAGQILEGLIPIASLPQLVSINGLNFVRPSYTPTPRAGSVDDQGDQAMRSDLAKSTFGIDGTGERIGVLSDSFDTVRYPGNVDGVQRDIQTGDLPADTQVLLDFPGQGTDEGRGMAQLIHDVAPGAGIRFATADLGEANFANNILQLAAAGCDIIVDDVFYFDEPFFQNGVVARAVNQVVNNGVAYFSSAGNDGTDSYEAPFRDSGLTGVNDGELHDFDPGPGVSTMQQVTIPVGSRFPLALQWDQPFASLGGPGATTDLDIYLLAADGTTVVDFANDFNVGADPIEVLNFTNNTSSTKFFLQIEKFEGPDPGLLKYVVFSNGAPISIDTFATNSSTDIGHANAENAIGVAASAYFFTPQFGATPPRVNEFSSLGGTPLLFTDAGVRRPTPLTTGSPQVTGVDGTNTTFFGNDISLDSDNFPNFFGTSAAAPHVAAVAALMKQAAGGPASLTPAQIKQVLQDTAIDILNREDFGFNQIPIPNGAGHDLFTGAGLVDAFAAVQSILSNISIGADVAQLEGDTGQTTNFIFPVTFTGVVTQTITVAYTTINNTAIAGSDYTATSGTITFSPGGSKTFSITVPVSGDTLVEPDESFTVSLSGAVNATVARAQAVGTIQNDDAALSIGDVTLLEGDSGTTSAVFTVTANGSSHVNTTVAFSTAPGTATAPSDYGATSGTLTFTPGQTQRQITVPIVGDTAVESDESFTVGLSGPTHATLTRAQATGTIQNDDLSLSINDVAVLEGDSGTTNAIFTVTAQGSSHATTTVQFATANGTATAPGDYTAQNGTLSFTPGVTQRQITVPINGDTTPEPDETYFINLTNATHATLADGQGLGTITNDDRALAIQDVSVVEGDSGTVNAIFTVTLNGNAAGSSTVQFATSAGTATAEVDYNSTSGTLTFSPGVNQQQITVPVTGDTLSEANETFTVTLSNATNASISRATATGTIQNDDLGVSVLNAAFLEGDSGNTAAILSVLATFPSVRSSTVAFATSNGTATAPEDYQAQTGTLTFAPNDQLQNITIQLTGDTVIESDETFAVDLSGITNGQILGGHADVTIQNDDITLAIDDVTVLEGDSGTTDAVFAVTATGVSHATSTVGFQTVDGTALSPEDYTAQSGTLTFAPGVAQQFITVQIQGDTTVESDESFSVQLGDTTHATLTKSLGAGTIENDDLHFSVGDVSVLEGDAGTTNLVFTITAEGVRSVPATLQFATADGTASAGSDYTAQNGTLTFAPGTLQQQVTIQVLGDAQAEDDETFFVNLTGAVNGTIIDAQGVGTIQNDDLAISIADTAVLEGDSGNTAVIFTITATHASARTTAVGYTTANGTALAGADYVAQSGTLTFAPGDTTKQITVQALGDTAVEADETLLVNLSTATGLELLRGQATGTIQNDDLGLAIDDVTVTEGDSGITAAVFTVTAQGTSHVTSTVLFATANGTATAGSDLNALNGTLTFAPGVTTQQITVEVLGDLTVESDETFLVNLSGATHATITRAQGTGTIGNDDLSFTISDATIIEGDFGTLQAVLTVTAQGVVHDTATVQFATADGTAKAPGDYVAVTGALSFPSGALTRLITVPIVGDLIQEATESFTVHLSDAVNAQIATDIGTVTIEDTDPPPVMYVDDVHVTTQPDGSWAEVFTAFLDVPSGLPITIHYETADGTAHAGINYQAVSGNLTFDPGTTSQQIVVPVLSTTTFSATKKFVVNLSDPGQVVLGDAQGTGSIVFLDPPTTQFILDDGDAGFSKNAGWVSDENLAAYQTDSLTHPQGSGLGVATWNFGNVPAGTYQVFAHWNSQQGSATNAPYTVLDGNTPRGTVLANQLRPSTGQMANDVSWQNLGSFQVSNGSLVVRLSDSANGLVNADAIRIVASSLSAPAPAMAVLGYSQPIPSGETQPIFDNGTDFSAVAAITNSTTHAFTIANTGNSPLHLTGNPAISLSGPNAADFSVVAQPSATIATGGSTSFQIIFHPSAVGPRKATVSIVNDAGQTYTFMIQGTGAPPQSKPLLIDDTTTGFSASAGWSTNINPASNNGQFHVAPAGQGSEKTTWTFQNLPPWQYDVYTTWVPFGNRATNAPFTVGNGSASDALVTVNQQNAPQGETVDGVTWNFLSSYYAAGGTLQVGLSNQANGFVVADAIRLVPIVVPHNATISQDVNGDLRVSSLDALLVINFLISHQTSATSGAATLSATPASSAAGDAPGPVAAGMVLASNYFVDVNGDGIVSPRDVLMVFNYLLHPSGGSGSSAVPAALPAATAGASADDGTQAVAVDLAISQLAAPAATSDDDAVPAVTSAASTTGASNSPSTTLLLTPNSVRAAFASRGKANDLNDLGGL